MPLRKFRCFLWFLDHFFSPEDGRSGGWTLHRGLAFEFHDFDRSFLLDDWLFGNWHFWVFKVV